MTGSRNDIGGKAWHLRRMRNAGFPVPPFLVLPAGAVDGLLAPVRAAIEARCRHLESMRDGTPDNKIAEAFSECAAAIQSSILTIDLSEARLRDLYAACEREFGTGYLVAVRSSAIAEDSATASFAGQHDTFLNIGSRTLGSHVLMTIASGWSLAALIYRRIHGMPLRNIRFAVIIQAMVDAGRSGVGFSMSLKGNMSDMLLVAGFGSGEGIVNDRTESDTYSVNRQRRTISRTTTLPAPVLSDAEIFGVCDYLDRAELLLHTPADIEFSFDKTGRLFILQMRAITAISREKIKILDNTNIVESYPGVSLPLTYSFIAQAYRQVFTDSARAFMIPAATIRRYAEVFDHLLAHVKGRIYYRLDNWYRMLALVYNSRKSLEAWEEAVGLRDQARTKVPFSFRNKARSYVSSAWLLLNYRRGNRRFFREFRQNYPLLCAFKVGDPAALFKHYERSAVRLFRPWHLTIVNDFLAFKSFGWLRDLIRRYGMDKSGNLANDLLCGVGGVESEAAILRVLEMKEYIQQDAGLTRLFTQPVCEIWAALHQPGHRAFSQQVSEYLEKYGDRTLAELKLETKSMRTDPLSFISMIRNQLLSPVTAASFRRQQVRIRTAAERKVYDRLKWWHPGRYWLTAIVRLARYALKNRENMRFCRTRAYGAVKDLFRAIGTMMAVQGIIAGPEDVYYLRLDELEAFCKHGSMACKMAAVAALKAEYGEYGRYDLPDRIIYVDDVPEFDAPEKSAATNGHRLSGDHRLTGVAVSKGRIEAEGVVISEPSLDEDVRGKILICAMTDPGWVFLMAQAAGLVCEKGSLLSHTAIVARELGIPVVVAIPRVTSIFKTGDRLRLDGNAGTVELVPVPVITKLY